MLTLGLLISPLAHAQFVLIVTTGHADSILCVCVNCIEFVYLACYFLFIIYTLRFIPVRCNRRKTLSQDTYKSASRDRLFLVCACGGDNGDHTGWRERGWSSCWLDDNVKCRFSCNIDVYLFLYIVTAHESQNICNAIRKIQTCLNARALLWSTKSMSSS